MAKFKKAYNDQTVEKTINFFRKRLNDQSSRICDVMEEILCESDSYNRNQIILHLNKFAKWYSNFYEKLPNDDFKKAYFKMIREMWKEKNHAKERTLGINSSNWNRAAIAHMNNIFTALFRSEFKRLKS